MRRLRPWGLMIVLGSRLASAQTPIGVDSGLFATLLAQKDRQTEQDAQKMHRWEAAHDFFEVTLDTTHGTLAAQLAAAVQHARQLGLTPVADVGAAWCDPCVLVDSVIHLVSMRDVMKKMYVIHLDIDQWETPLEAMGADVSTGIPRVLALDHAGRLSGDPWRPRDLRTMLHDVPDSVWKGKPGEGFRLSLIRYLTAAQARFAEGPPGHTPD